MEWTPTYPYPGGLMEYPAVGGGQYYRGQPSSLRKADYAVTSRTQLRAALANADPGEMIRVDDDVDLTGVRRLPISTAGLTLAGDRGAFSPGAILGTANSGEELFRITARDVRITGLRLQGADDTYGADGASVGVRVSATGAEIDNCGIRGFGYAGILHGQHGWAGKLEVHHNAIIDCPKRHLGYGIAVYHGRAVVHHNYLNYCRHEMAGGGAVDCWYRFVDNYLGPQAVLHPIDMHPMGGAGGKALHVRHNIVEAQEAVDTRGSDGYQSAVHVRANPREESTIAHNAFGNTQSGGYTWGDAIECSGFKPPGNLQIEGNQFGDAVPRSDAVGIRPDDGSRDGSSDDETIEDPSMTYPTADRYGETYDVGLHGTGDVSQYRLTAADGVAFPNNEEKHERIEGRTAYGQLSTHTDTVRCTGPITALSVTSGDVAIEVEIDGEVYGVDDFPDIEKDGGQVTGALRFEGKTYDVTLDVRER